MVYVFSPSTMGIKTRKNVEATYKRRATVAYRNRRQKFRLKPVKATIPLTTYLSLNNIPVHGSIKVGTV